MKVLGHCEVSALSESSRKDSKANRDFYRRDRVRQHPFLLWLLCLVLAACEAESDDDPVAATKRFLSAVSRGDCMEAWSHYSFGAQENIRREVHRMYREADRPLEAVTPENRYCVGGYGELKSGSARLIKKRDNEAVVAVVLSSGTRLALLPFLSKPYREWNAEMQLVREVGTWKIERPRVPIGRKGWELVEVGPVDVAYSLHSDPKRKWVEATAVLRAPREALQQVLLDAESWPRLLPELSRVEVIDTSEGDKRLRLRFGAWDQPIVVETKPHGNLVSPRLPWSTLQWIARDVGSTSVLFTGAWKLRPRYEGTWVTLSLVIEPDQWPADLASRIVSADRIAAAVLALEEKALSTAAMTATFSTNQNRKATEDSASK